MTSELFTALIYQPDFLKEQAVFFKTSPTDSGKLDIEITTPITIDTTMRDIEVDLLCALTDCGIREKINEISTLTPLRK